MTSLGEKQALAFWRLRWALRAAEYQGDGDRADDVRSEIEAIGASTQLPTLHSACREHSRPKTTDIVPYGKSPA